MICTTELFRAINLKQKLAAFALTDTVLALLEITRVIKAQFLARGSVSL